jgi:hypothetical protein
MPELLHNPKIKPEHLARKAIVYLRQSSERLIGRRSQLVYDFRPQSALGTRPSPTSRIQPRLKKVCSQKWLNCKE